MPLQLEGAKTEAADTKEELETLKAEAAAANESLEKVTTRNEASERVLTEVNLQLSSAREDCAAAKAEAEVNAVLQHVMASSSTMTRNGVMLTTVICVIILRLL